MLPEFELSSENLNQLI